MFFQTLLQSLLKKQKVKESETAKDLSPMAQSIMQKLAEHDKNQSLNHDLDNQPEPPLSPAYKSTPTK
jgi:hypothetical protein